MAVGGIPDGRKGHPQNACKAARDIIQVVAGLNTKRQVFGQIPWEVRVGVHTGPIIAGFSSSGFDIWGDAVNLASRLESASEAVSSPLVMYHPSVEFPALAVSCLGPGAGGYGCIV